MIEKSFKLDDGNVCWRESLGGDLLKRCDESDGVYGINVGEKSCKI